MQLLLPFVESALPLAYGVVGVQLFHVRIFAFAPTNLISSSETPASNKWLLMHVIFRDYLVIDLVLLLECSFGISYWCAIDTSDSVLDWYNMPAF